MDKLDEIEQRLDGFISRQAEMEQHLATTQELLNQLKKKQIKEGPLAALANALEYHHHMVNGWTRLAAKGGTYEEYATEFGRMREVVIQYEYATQIVLGINPSPLADLE
jgi:hypothetical protein